MADPILPPDFSEFLRLLNEHRVDYLIVGGYAVAFHGHPRATADIDIWVPMEEETAEQLVTVLKMFGFDIPELSREVFLRPGQIIRLGAPPLRIELLTTIAGVDFRTCHSRAVRTEFDEVEVRVIALDDLKTNKRAAGRHQDLADLEHLP
jgi:hypothetical protein